MEAAWRLENFPLCGKSHNLIRLAVHTENQHRITFTDGEEYKALNKYRTTLTEFFKLNKRDINARKYKYAEIPKHYNWDTINKEWVNKIYNTNAIKLVG